MTDNELAEIWEARKGGQIVATAGTARGLFRVLDEQSVRGAIISKRPKATILPGEAGYRFSDKGMGAVVPPEIACRCHGMCTGDLRPEDLPDPSKWCRHCGHMDPYTPCPRLGFGCGVGAKADTEPCECCSPEEWQRARDET